jgi:hypothetical protein
VGGKLVEAIGELCSVVGIEDIEEIAALAESRRRQQIRPVVDGGDIVLGRAL